MKQPDFRAAVFGIGGGMDMKIVMVSGPKTVEDCGMYIHADDVEKYLEYAKQFEDPNNETKEV